MIYNPLFYGTVNIRFAFVSINKYIASDIYIGPLTLPV